MPRTVHLYVFEGYADWEPAFAVAGLNQPQFQREPGAWQVRTVGVGRSAVVRSMGGVAVLPDLALDDIRPEDSALLILPGGRGWEDEPHAHLPALERAAAWLQAGVPVAAICGATAGLARIGALDGRLHTSNALSYLKGVKQEGYAGSDRYDDRPAVRDRGLITAGGMAPIEFAREIFAELGVYEAEVLEAWYRLYKEGDAGSFMKMAQAGAGR